MKTAVSMLAGWLAVFVCLSALSLEALSRGLLPDRGLPMSISTAAFRGPTGTPVVLVTTGVMRIGITGGQVLRRDVRFTVK